VIGGECGDKSRPNVYKLSIESRKDVSIWRELFPRERGEIGRDMFRAACRMDLQGLVSKRRDRPYQSGRSKHWINLFPRWQHTARGVVVGRADAKNRIHPAVSRMIESFG
jgi:ATP-dependent DNA ligase